RLKTSIEIDSAVEQLTNNIVKAAKVATPIIPTDDNREITYPMDIKNLVQQKRRARRTWHNTRHPTDKTEWNRVSKILHNKIKEMKNVTFKSYVCGLSATDNTDYSLWKATRHMKRPRVQVPPIRKEDGTWARSEQEKAEIYARHLERVFLPNAIDSELDIVQCPQLSTTRKKIKNFTPLEVAKVIDDSLNPKKAPGYDEISPKILKELPKKAIIHLTHIYNAILRMEYIPEQWKRAQVIMLLKPGKPPEDVTSYRPISLLPSLSKLLEKLLLKRLKPIIEEKHLIPDHQFGFRNKHSTIDQ
ncbi:Reverse transcriptase domain, partial [Cinara cedri]